MPRPHVMPPARLAGRPVWSLRAGVRLGILGLSLGVAQAAQADAWEVRRATDMRAGADGVSRIIGRLPPGAVVEGLPGRFGPWVQVRTAEGHAGWVLRLDLLIPPPVASAPTGYVQIPVLPTPPARASAPAREPAAVGELSPSYPSGAPVASPSALPQVPHNAVVSRQSLDSAPRLAPPLPSPLRPLPSAAVEVAVPASPAGVLSSLPVFPQAAQPMARAAAVPEPTPVAVTPFPAPAAAPAPAPAPVVAVAAVQAPALLPTQAPRAVLPANPPAVATPLATPAPSTPSVPVFQIPAALPDTAPGMSPVLQMETLAQDSEPARKLYFENGFDLVKLPASSARRSAMLEGLSALPLASERLIGRQYAASQLNGKSLSPDLNLQRYVNLLGRWLSLESARPNLPWAFAVLEDNRFDAGSAPGGYVWVTRGLVERVGSEAELAAVLAHQISHVAVGHHLRGGDARAPQESDQLEADVLASELLARTGFDPAALQSLLERMSRASMWNRGNFNPMRAERPDPRQRVSHLYVTLDERLLPLGRGKPVVQVEQRLRALDARPSAAAVGPATAARTAAGG